MFSSNIRLEWSQLQSPLVLINSFKVKFAEIVSLLLFAIAVSVLLISDTLYASQNDNMRTLCVDNDTQYLNVIDSSAYAVDLNVTSAQSDVLATSIIQCQ